MACVVYGLAAQSQTGWLYLGLSWYGGALLVGLVGPSLMVRGLRAEASAFGASGAPHEGDPLTMEVTFTNLSRRPRYWLTLRDESGLSDPTMNAEQGGGHLFVPYLAPRRSLTARWLVPARRRGVFGVGQVCVASTAPFGLLRAEVTFAAPDRELVVYPRRWPLPHVGAGGREGDGLISRRQTSGAEFYGTRPYRTGDSLRLVHWRSTARRGSLVVRELEQPSLPALTIVLVTALPAFDARDKREAAAAVERGHVLFETAVRLAASAVRWGDLHGYAVHLRSDSVEPAAPRPTGDGVTRRQADNYLTRVQPTEIVGSTTHQDAGLAVDALLGGVPAGYLALVVAPHPSPALLPALQALHRRCARLTVALGGVESTDVVLDPEVSAGGTVAQALARSGIAVTPFGPHDETVVVALC